MLIPNVGGPGGNGRSIPNAGLYSNGAAGAGMLQYGAPNAGVVNQKKPLPRGVRPMFPLVTNDPGPQVPPPKPSMGSMAGMPIFNGTGAPRTALPPRAFEGMGNDLFYGDGSGPVPPINRPNVNPSGVMKMPVYEPGTPPSTTGQPRPFVGFGNDVIRPGEGGLQGSGIQSGFGGWTPLYGGGGQGDRDTSWASRRARIMEKTRGLIQKGAKGPQLPGNQGPNYAVNSPMDTSNWGWSWWKDPGKATSNAGGWWHDPSGAGQDMDMYMRGLTPYGTPLGTGPGGAPLGGGGFLGGYTPQKQSSGGGGGGRDGGGYAPGVQEFVDAMNQSNAANARRRDNVTSGYEAMKNWIYQQMSGLGEQQRKDINTTFDKEKGRLTQDMISRGLTASTVLDNMQKGNERTRSESLNRLADQLTMNMVNTTLPVWGKELDFLSDIQEEGPNLGLMAQLLQQANSAGGGGGMGGGGSGGGGGGGGRNMGAGIPITIDSQDLGFQVPASMFGYGGGSPGWIQGGGSTLPQGRVAENLAAKLRHQFHEAQMRGPRSPMVFSPYGHGGIGGGSGMTDFFNPGMFLA